MCEGAVHAVMHRSLNFSNARAAPCDEVGLLPTSDSLSSTSHAPTHTSRSMRLPTSWQATALLALPGLAQAWYLPGAAPHSYKRGDAVPFMVNALQPMASTPGQPPAGSQGTGSSATQLKSITSLNYYDPRLHMCEPKGGPQSQSENLGSVLFGDRIFNSPIEAKLLMNESCVNICNAQIPSEDMVFINERIQEQVSCRAEGGAGRARRRSSCCVYAPQYAVNWMIDGLPIATKKVADRTHEICECHFSLIRVSPAY